MTHRFAHLSDIHFGQGGHGTLPKHEAVRKAVLKDVKHLAEKRGPASRVLVTGDVAFPENLSSSILRLWCKYVRGSARRPVEE